MLLDVFVEPAPLDVADSDLLARYHAGDREAFSTLYDRYCDGLYRYARALSRDYTLSDDLVQEAFVRLLNYDKSRFVDSIQVFLFTIIRNLYRDELRKSGVRRKSQPLVAQNVSAAAPEEEKIEHRHLQKALDRLNALPDDQREVVVLRIYGGLSFTEIGTLMRAATQTVASRYRYALEKMARDIAID